MNALAQLGMVSELPSENQTNSVTLEVAIDPARVAIDPARKDYFIEKDGMRFAGTHLLVDLWQAHRLSDPVHIDTALRAAAVEAGATILHSHFHRFSPNGGVSGVVVLAESHISIHTWPEREFAAIDIFVCGDCNPHAAIPVLQEAFAPGRIDLEEHRRGRF